jgi:hypothetical protein
MGRFTDPAQPKPTEKQIEAEIKKLTQIKPNVRKTSVFGDNHWDAIDAQIEVLKNYWTEDDVYDNFPSQEDLESRADHGEEIDDIIAYPDNVRSEALEAARWLAGESEFKKLSDNWKELLIKK